MVYRLEDIKAKWNIEPFISGSTIPWGKDDVVWLVSEVERLKADRDLANKQLEALRWQVEHEGCAASHLGETTYECRADAPCGLCRLRSERDAMRAENERPRREHDDEAHAGSVAHSARRPR